MCGMRFTRPIAAHDLMMQISLIVRHPFGTKPGKTDILVSSYDFLPSLWDHLDMKDRIPTKQKLPWRSFAAAMCGEPIKWETAMYYEIECRRSVRTEDWKYVARRSPDGLTKLYDMKHDPHERFKLFGQPQLANVQAALAEQLDDFFDEYADPQYDIWQGDEARLGDWLLR